MNQYSFDHPGEYPVHPWKNIALHNGCWVSPQDVAAVNDRDKIILYKKRSDFFDLTYPPEPYVGNKEAGIYLLLANPGLPAEGTVIDNDTVAILKANLDHSLTKFYPLSEKFKNKWWYTVFYPLLRDLYLHPYQSDGVLSEAHYHLISDHFFCLEMSGYHSKDFNAAAIKNLQSGDYAKHLLRVAMHEKKLILLPRSAANWLRFVPELAFYPNCHIIGSTRPLRLSRSTLSPHLMLTIAEKLGCLSCYTDKLRENQTIGSFKSGSVS